MTEGEQFGSFVRHAMRVIGIDSRELSRRTSLSKVTISRNLNGHTLPHYSSRVLYARAFKMEPDEFEKAWRDHKPSFANRRDVPQQVRPYSQPFPQPPPLFVASTVADLPKAYEAGRGTLAYFRQLERTLLEHPTQNPASGVRALAAVRETIATYDRLLTQYAAIWAAFSEVPLALAVPHATATELQGVPLPQVHRDVAGKIGSGSTLVADAPKVRQVKAARVIRSNVTREPKK